jgi:hypothetical protein
MVCITVNDLQRVTCPVAELSNVFDVFNKSKEKNCRPYNGVMKQHEQVSVNWPQATSISKETGLNKDRKEEFFIALQRFV